MDGARFDDLTRRMASKTLSRRTAFRALAGTALGAALAHRSLDGVGASCPSNQVYRRSLGCVCKGTGRPPGPDGRCPCPREEVDCGGDCVDTLKDRDHCGA